MQQETFLPSEKMRAMTYKTWKTKYAGNGMGGREMGSVCVALNCREKDVYGKTIGEITDAHAPAGRGLARYANENFPRSGFAVSEGLWGKP